MARVGVGVREGTAAGADLELQAVDIAVMMKSAIYTLSSLNIVLFIKVLLHFYSPSQLYDINKSR